MTDEGKKTDNEVTPEGAVEINEQDLDAASGGLLPAVKLGLAGNKLDNKLGLVGAGPGAGPHVKGGDVQMQDFHKKL